MPRPVSIPKYRKHSSGQARVSLNGRDYLLGPHSSKASIREYDRLVAEYLSSGRSVAFGVDASEDVLTVAMVMAAYLKHCRGYYGRVRRQSIIA